MTVRLLQGDARKVLRTLPDGFVHCVVTSPPYWGLRRYLPEGHPDAALEMGSEPTPDEYVAGMVEVFREVRRVLRDDGTVWLNLGDAYASGGRSSRDHDDKLPARHLEWRPQTPSGLKPKDLIGLPWMVAFALRADGWWLRQDNIWGKRSCMPESVRDRTTRAHEYVFQLTKSGAPLFWTHRTRNGTRTCPDPDYRWTNRERKEEVAACPEGWPEVSATKKLWRRINLWTGHDIYYDATAIEEDGVYPAGTHAGKGSRKRSDSERVNSRPPDYATYDGKRNKRSVWWETTTPFPDAHFATMPPSIAETCILAGSSERGCCPGCGAPWARVTEKTRTFESGSGRGGNLPAGKNGASMQGGGATLDVRRGPCVSTDTAGWRPTCDCPAHDPIPCVVLDCFAGAFTTCLVADRLQRDAIGIELNADYIAMARRRLSGDAALFMDMQ